jgi:hypothetical protein
VSTPLLTPPLSPLFSLLTGIPLLAPPLLPPFSRPQVARDSPYAFFFFGSYETSRSLLSKFNSCTVDQLSFPYLFVSGGLASSLAWALVFPIDVCKSRMQTDHAKETPALSTVMRRVLREEGVGALYRGCSAALMRAFPANAALMAGYEISRRAMDT